MAGNLDDMFSNKETCNWFKASIALIITKQGLEKFVDSEIQKLHANVGRACGNCFTENLIKCPTYGVCRNAKSCSFHNTPGLLPCPCPMNICDQVKQNIASHHRYSNPSWKNTRTELWAANHWEIAKCYLPPDGYIDVASVQDTDFNGVISVILNCTHFDKCFSFNIAPRFPSPECILTQVRQIGRDVRHTSSCQVADSDLKNIILKLQSLLTDPVSLANDPNASSAINTLRKLKNNTQFITPDELLEHLKDARQNLVKINDQSERRSKEVDTVLLEIDTHMKQCLQQIEESENEARERISKEGKEVLAQIESHRLASAKMISEKEKEVKQKALETEKIAREVHQKAQEIEHTAHNVEIHAANVFQHTLTIDKKAQEIGNKIEIIEQKLNETEMINNDLEIEDLRRRLIQHYNNTLNLVTLSPLNPSFGSATPIDNVYATPNIFRMQMNKPTLKRDYPCYSNFQKKYDQCKEREICLYKDLFDTNDKLNGRIFLQGDAGTGKTMFVAKLVLDWCKVSHSSCYSGEDETDFNDFASLAGFSFVFLVTLRDSLDEREIPKMIKEHIIDMVYSDIDRDKAYILLQRIMEKKICLVIQDGLDEWRDTKGKLILPLMVECHNKCTLLITTRPWKLADERIRDSQIDGLYLLDGVKDVFTLSRKVMGYLVPEKLHLHYCFEQYVKSKQLEELLSKPILLKIIVSLWAANTCVEGSMCKIYSILQDGLLKKVSDEVAVIESVEEFMSA
ncbi:uncharacterized protein LOC127870195 [Dreissena polymorpha]|uniref:uncharacterized protein LOC127870195 n=1 Tax=Dreissena polymorpha TaxID=45954 RepID=UPI002263D1D5|nr:uncharacterized protein LOC127870195 [Dreissena polymorpha]